MSNQNLSLISKNKIKLLIPDEFCQSLAENIKIEFLLKNYLKLQKIMYLKTKINIAKHKINNFTKWFMHISV